MVTRKVLYRLDVYEPGEYRTAVASFDLPTPPASIAVGDLLDPLCWAVERRDRDYFLEVVRVIHLISEVGDEVLHKVCLATRKVPRSDRLVKPER